MRTLITYDVVDDKRRTLLVKVLEAVGQRVQKSVFEAQHLEAAAYLRMRSNAEGVIDLSEDGIRYYRLCAACVGRIEHVGAGTGLIALPPAVRIL